MVFFSCILFHRLEIVEHPGFFDISLERAIEPENHEEALVGIGLDEVLLLALRGLLAEVDVHRTVRVGIHPARAADRNVAARIQLRLRRS